MYGIQFFVLKKYLKYSCILRFEEYLTKTNIFFKNEELKHFLLFFEMKNIIRFTDVILQIEEVYNKKEKTHFTWFSLRILC